MNMTRAFTAALCCFFLLAPSHGKNGTKPEAEQILDTAGIRAGLIVFIASGESKETAELAGALAGSGNFLVHLLTQSAKYSRQ